MNIVEINMLHAGSTGNLMRGIAHCARESGHAVWTFSPYVFKINDQIETPELPGHQYFGSNFESMLHLLLAKTTGFYGFFSTFGTWQLLRELDRIHPDVIHLHNLHNWTIDVRLLFAYIKKRRIKAVWTLHDCWSMTGRCPHFTMIGCGKWKTGCGNCPQLHTYPKTYVDQTHAMWKLKRKWFTNVENLTLVTPSQWLADLVKESYLKEYPVQVIHNGIDLNIFQPTNSDFRKIHGIRQDQFVLLGVAFGWEKSKGLDVFLELSKRLPENYRIVLVGTDSLVDAQLPGNIISIHRTQNQQELVQIYTAADVFVNPTREEVFGLVNAEALACGTPVITFRTGGSVEVADETCGCIVDVNDVDALEQQIIRICQEQPYSAEACIRRAKQFDKDDKFREYIALY